MYVQAAVQYEALMQMEYLDSVVNESLRLYPIAPRLERVAKATVEINGLVIPRETVVMVPTWVLHHDPDLWQNPEEFKPERYVSLNCFAQADSDEQRGQMGLRLPPSLVEV